MSKPLIPCSSFLLFMCSLTCAVPISWGSMVKQIRVVIQIKKKSPPAQDYFNLEDFPNLINFMSTCSHIDTAEEEAHWWVVGTILVEK